MRADRLNIKNDQFFLLTETHTAAIFKAIKKLKPTVVIVDSIQTLESNVIEAAAGSVSQIKQTAAEFQRFAKETGTPVFFNWTYYQRRNHCRTKNIRAYGGYRIAI